MTTTEEITLSIGTVTDAAQAWTDAVADRMSAKYGIVAVKAIDAFEARSVFRGCLYVEYGPSRTSAILACARRITATQLHNIIVPGTYDQQPADGNELQENVSTMRYGQF